MKRVGRISGPYCCCPLAYKVENIYQGLGIPPGFMTHVPAGGLQRTRISFGTLRSVVEYGLPLPFTGCCCAEGGRPSEELFYTMKWLSEGSGTTYELVIQTPRPGVAPMATRSPPDVLSVRSMLQHLQAVRAAATLSVELLDVYATFSSIYLKKNLLYTLHRMTVT